MSFAESFALGTGEKKQKTYEWLHKNKISNHYFKLTASKHRSALCKLCKYITFFQGDDELIACLRAWLDTNKLIVGPLEERGTGWWMTSQDACFTWVKKKCLNRKCTQVYLIQLLVVQVYSYLVCYFMIVRVEGRDCLGPNSKHSLVPVTIATTVLHHNTLYGIHSNCTLHTHNNPDNNKLVIFVSA